jgi:hypothetical protein
MITTSTYNEQYLRHFADAKVSDRTIYAGKRGVRACGCDSGGPLANTKKELIGIMVCSIEHRWTPFGMTYGGLSFNRIFGSISLSDPEIRSFVQGYLN